MWMTFRDWDNSFNRMVDFRRRMNRLFEDFDQGSLSESNGWPRTRYIDNGESLILRAEIPGLAKNDLTLSIQNNQLTIKGERKTTVPEGYSVHRKERKPVRFSRSYSFTDEIDSEKVTATIDNGILTVMLPKAASAQPRQISVEAV